MLIANLGTSAAIKRQLLSNETDPTTGVTSRRLSAYNRMAAKREWAKPDYNLYNTLFDVNSKVSAIVQEHSDTMTIEDVEAEDNGYRAEIQVVTVEPGGLTDEATQSKKTRLFFNFGQHARELITSEVCLRLLSLLAMPIDELVARVAQRPDEQQRLKLILNNVVLKIVPMENQMGRKKVEAGDLCERKNGRGVDPNRNWEVDWGVKAPDYDPNEEYPGTRPFSEPEAQMILTQLKAFNPHGWVNVHSGMKALFMPYDHLARIPDGEDVMYSILSDLNAKHCRGKCAVGSGGKSVGYLAHGTATDYIFERLKIPLVFTWEIYGNDRAHYLDCFNMFNPLSADGYEDEVNNWSLAFFSLMNIMHQHPRIPRPEGLPEPLQRSEPIQNSFSARQTPTGSSGVRYTFPPYQSKHEKLKQRIEENKRNSQVQVNTQGVTKSAADEFRLPEVRINDALKQPQIEKVEKPQDESVNYMNVIMLVSVGVIIGLASGGNLNLNMFKGKSKRRSPRQMPY